MRRATRFLTAACAAAGCATGGPPPSGPIRRDPEARRAEREVARLTVERDELRRAEASRLLASLGSIRDEIPRRRAVVQALRLDAAWAVDFEPSEVAELAPDVLRVYDLSAVLDDGLDEGESARPQKTDRTFDGGERLLQRIAASVRAGLPEAAWPAGASAIEVAGECLLVVQSREAFGDVETALDRFATVGGGTVHVTAKATRGDDTRSLALDVPFGRRRESWDGTVTSYVKDFDVDAASGLADPRIDTIRDGIELAALYVPGAGGAPTLGIEVTATEVARPMPEFTTALGNAIPGVVRLQIPEVRVQRFHYDIPVTATPQSRVQNFPDGVVVTPTPEAIAKSPGNWTVELQVGPDDGSAPARPGWRAVAPKSAPPLPGQEPLVDNAIALAGAQLAGPGRIDAAATLRSAVLGARGSRWMRRVRIGAEGVPAVLVRRPVARAQRDVVSAIGASDVAVAQGVGFLAVEDGALVACVTPE